MSENNNSNELNLPENELISSNNNNLISQNESKSDSKRKKKLNKIKIKTSRKQNININDTINLINYENIDEPINQQLAISENNKILQNSSLLNKSEARIINELPKNYITNNKINSRLYKINIVFREHDFLINIKDNQTILDLKKKINKLLNIEIDKLAITYENNEITDKQNEILIKTFFNFAINKSRPILYVRTKPLINNLLSSDRSYNNIKYNYEHKVKIINYPSIINSDIEAKDDIYCIINNFIKEKNLKPDFSCDKREENEYVIGFNSPDIAFDFNRYMNSLRILNPTFKNIKIQILLSKQNRLKKRNNSTTENNVIKKKNHNYNYRYGIYLNLDQNDVEQRNLDIINLISEKFKNNNINRNNESNFLNIFTPYITPYDEDKIEKLENKKRWICPEGFITSVNKYSGIKI